MLISKLEELRIYQIAVRLRNELHAEVKKIPFNWKINEVDDIKRSSSSAASNISEGFGRRFYLKDFMRFLSYSIGSSDETQNHIVALYEDGHLTEDRKNYFFRGYKDLSIMTTNFRNHQWKKLNSKK